LGKYCVKKQIHFCYGHRLIDYEGKCRHLHGHNARLEIEICSDALDGLGMVIDFTEVGGIAKAWVNKHLDHKMLLHRNDPVVPLLQGAGEPLFLMDDNPTAENIAKVIFDALRTLGLKPARVTLWETETGAASYTGE
jgi:6-pyruvoyltetrahydropterin/6-carboxytetrahydropterin synthase